MDCTTSRNLPPEYYQPLETRNSDIRILSILPSSDTDSEIHCSLNIHQLASCKYDALSYCWGLEPEKPIIDVSGAKLRVKPNLFAALRRLREATDVVHLWVDAICINQQDPIERDNQIPIMGRIYKGARIVYAWLGEATPGSAEAMYLLQQLQLLVYGDNPQQIHILKNERYLLGWRSLIELLRRPYWTRAWILQEILLAENVMVVVGKHKVAWPTMAVLTLIIPAWDEEMTSTEDESNPFYETLRMLRYNMYDIIHLSNLQLGLLSGPSDPQSSSGFLDLLDCLTMCRWRFATDQRDHVYSMLSLADAAHIRPDYKKPVKWLFGEVVRRDIEMRGKLDVLSGCKHFAEEEKDIPKFMSKIQEELMLNQEISQETFGMPTSFPLGTPSWDLDIGQHPVWYEKTAEWIAAASKDLTRILQELIDPVDSGHGQDDIQRENSSQGLLLLLEALKRSKLSYSPNTEEIIERLHKTVRYLLVQHQLVSSNRMLNASLPTWTPNWTMPLLSPRQNLLLYEGCREIYRASGHTKPKVFFDHTKERMTFEGFHVDDVVCVPRIEAQDPFKGYWEAATDYELSATVYGDALDLLEAFRELLSLQRTNLSLFTLQHVILEGVEVKGSAHIEPSASPTTERAAQEIQSVYSDWIGESNRQFFITTSGYFGAGPRQMKAGDLVVIPLGSRTPFLLRKHQDTFSLVEECCKYSMALVIIRCFILTTKDVQGFMDGEVLRTPDKGSRWSREFCVE